MSLALQNCRKQIVAKHNTVCDSNVIFSSTFRISVANVTY
jgi:hypothetical protein